MSSLKQRALRTDRGESVPEEPRLAVSNAPDAAANAVSDLRVDQQKAAPEHPKAVGPVAVPSVPSGSGSESVERKRAVTRSLVGEVLAVISGRGEGMVGALCRVFNSVGGALLLWRLLQWAAKKWMGGAGRRRQICA